MKLVFIELLVVGRINFLFPYTNLDKFYRRDFLGIHTRFHYK